MATASGHFSSSAGGHRTEEEERRFLEHAIREREAQLQQLLPRAEQLRSQHHALMEDHQRRLDLLEDNLLASKFVAVDGMTADRMLRDEERNEACCRALEDMQDQDQHDELLPLRPALAAERAAEKADLEYQEYLKGLPMDPTLPPGSRVVHIRRYDAADCAMPPPMAGITGEEFAMPSEKQPEKVKMGNGLVMQSNALVKPSPLHGNGGEGVYPITHPPVRAWVHHNFLDLRNPKYAQNDTYEAPADYLDSRNFPASWKDTQVCYDAKGEKYVEETWRPEGQPKTRPYLRKVDTGGKFYSNCANALSQFVHA